MFANDICVTSVSGGAGDLTLSAVASGLFTHSPTFQDVWGTGSPDPWVSYKIIEYTDATLLVQKQWELGLAPLHAGVTLKRSASTATVKATYVYGTGVTPSAANAGPATTVNFGSTAANIRIFSSWGADDQYQEVRQFNETNAGTGGYALPGSADLIGRPTGHAVTQPPNQPGGVAGSSIAFAGGTYLFFPYLATEFALFSSISIMVYSAGVSGNKARVGLYAQDGTGWAGALIADSAAMVGGSEFDLSATGFKTSTTSSSLLMRPEWYWVALQCNGTGSLSVVLKGTHSPLLNPAGTYQTNNIRVGFITGTYGAMPSNAPTSSLVTWYADTALTPSVYVA